MYPCRYHGNTRSRALGSDALILVPSLACALEEEWLRVMPYFLDTLRTQKPEQSAPLVRLVPPQT